MNINKIQENFDFIAAKYDTHRRCFIPGFDDYYKNSLTLLKTYRNDFKNILDLGAGTGLLTNSIYQLYPDALYTLVDISNEMLKVAKERFSNLDNFKYITGDYTKEIFENNYDLICSALSIHHLAPEAKISIYQNAYNHLEHSGCFINLDQFIASDTVINQIYEKWWLDFIDKSVITAEEKKAWLKRKELDIENSIEDTIQILKKTGFQKVECIYHFMKFGVIVCIK